MQGVYLLHFSAPLGDPDTHVAQHYLGWADDIDRRLQRHISGWGASITRAATQRGLDLLCVRRWNGATRTDERRLKNQKNAPRYCPLCCAQHGRKVRS